MTIVPANDACGFDGRLLANAAAIFRLPLFRTDGVMALSTGVGTISTTGK
jgi:hypothetical protein